MQLEQRPAHKIYRPLIDALYTSLYALVQSVGENVVFRDLLDPKTDLAFFEEFQDVSPVAR